MTNTWHPKHIEWLFIGVDLMNMTFSECVDHMEREYKRHQFKRSQLIGKYWHEKNKGYVLPEKTLREFRGVV